MVKPYQVYRHKKEEYLLVTQRPYDENAWVIKILSDTHEYYGLPLVMATPYALNNFFVLVANNYKPHN